MRTLATLASWRPSVNAADAHEYRGTLQAGFSNQPPPSYKRSFRPPGYQTSPRYGVPEERHHYSLPSVTLSSHLYLDLSGRGTASDFMTCRSMKKITPPPLSLRMLRITPIPKVRGMCRIFSLTVSYLNEKCVLFPFLSRYELSVTCGTWLNGYVPQARRKEFEDVRDVIFKLFIIGPARNIWVTF